MSVYLNEEMHQLADAVLAEMRTVPAQDKMSKTLGDWASFERIQKHIHANRKQTGLYLDTETLLSLLGILSGRNQIEIGRAHGRGVGYFWIFRPKPEPEP